MACACRVDLDVLAGLAGTADALTDAGRRMRLADWIAEFRKAMLDELDYRIEAENLERFARHLAGYARLRVPRPLWDYVTPRLLVMEWIDGINVTRISSAAHRGHRPGDRGAAARHSTRPVHGDIHADPHPGNVLLCPIIAPITCRSRPSRRASASGCSRVFAAVDGRGEDVARELVALGTAETDESACARGVAGGGALAGLPAARPRAGWC